MKFSTVIALALISVTAVLLTGCETPNAGGPTAAVPTAQVEVFHDGTKPAKPFKEIGTLTDDGKEEEQAEIEAKMIKKAQKMGGHAIIFAAPKQSGMEAAGPFSFAAKFTFLYKGTVVVYE
jgi:hypothetical protein